MLSSGRFLALLLALTTVIPTFAQVVIHDVPCSSTNATGLCWDGAALWVSDYSTSIRRINPADGSVLRTIIGPVTGSDGLAFENGHLWTISRQNNDVTVYKLDTLTGGVVDEFPDPTGGNAGGAVWETNGIWMTQDFPVTRILKADPITEQVITEFPAPGDNPFGLAFDGTALWNSSEDDDDVDRIYRLNLASGEVLWSFDLPPHTPAPGRRPRGLAWDGQYLWVLAYQLDGFQIRIFQYDVSNALNPDIELAEDFHDFGGHVIGFPFEWSTWIRNIGNAPLVVDSLTFTVNQSYTVTAPGTVPFTVPIEDSVELSIQFAPPAPGNHEDTLLIHSNDPDEDPSLLQLIGTGLPDEGDIVLVPDFVDFGNVRIGPSPLLSSSRTVQIWNDGSGVLTLTDVEVVGQGFYMDGVPWPITIDSSSFYPVRIWFDPQQTGYHESIFFFNSDDPDNPEAALAVIGEGVDTPLEGGEILWWYSATGGFDHSINSITWINDVNGDGIADCIAASANHLVFCLNGSSTATADTFWTYNTGADNNHSGIVWYERGLHRIDDLNGDQVDDVILGTTGSSQSVYALSGVDGAELWMFDTEEHWGEGGWIYEVHPIEDVNNDGFPDVVAAAGGDQTGGPACVFAVSGFDGSYLWSGPQSTAYFTVRTIADVSGDGLPDVVGGSTDGVMVCIESNTGDLLWEANTIDDSPIFALLPMGNANPDVNLTEDIAVASAYEGAYAVDGGNGDTLWFTPITSNVYELAVGSDITADDVREVYVGLTNGLVICIDGHTGDQMWSISADPNAPENVLTLTAIPDVTGDGFMDLVAGTLGDVVTVLNGAFAGREWDATLAADAVDATGILPDIDGNGSWEILAGMRDGTMAALSGGLLVNASPDHPRVSAPLAFSLNPAYPNPFNATVTIPYAVPNNDPIKLRVYDVLGRHVATLFEGRRSPGEYRAIWEGRTNNGANVSSGTYIVTLQSPHADRSTLIHLLK